MQACHSTCDMQACHSTSTIHYSSYHFPFRDLHSRSTDQQIPSTDAAWRLFQCSREPVSETNLSQLNPVHIIPMCYVRSSWYPAIYSHISQTIVFFTLVLMSTYRLSHLPRLFQPVSICVCSRLKIMKPSDYFNSDRVHVPHSSLRQFIFAGTKCTLFYFCHRAAIKLNCS
jgi:hypothetical protein